MCFRWTCFCFPPESINNQTNQWPAGICNNTTWASSALSVSCWERNSLTTSTLLEKKTLTLNLTLTLGLGLGLGLSQSRSSRVKHLSLRLGALLLQIFDATSVLDEQMNIFRHVITCAFVEVWRRIFPLVSCFLFLHVHSFVICFEWYTIPVWHFTDTWNPWLVPGFTAKHVSFCQFNVYRLSMLFFTGDD